MITRLAILLTVMKFRPIIIGTIILGPIGKIALSIYRYARFNLQKKDRRIVEEIKKISTDLSDYLSKNLLMDNTINLESAYLYAYDCLEDLKEIERKEVINSGKENNLSKSTVDYLNQAIKNATLWEQRAYNKLSEKKKEESFQQIQETKHIKISKRRKKYMTPKRRLSRKSYNN